MLASQLLAAMEGQFLINADGSFVFQTNGEFVPLAEGEIAITTATYSISDGQGGVDTATIVVTVVGRNDTPVGSNIPNRENALGEEVAIDIKDKFGDPDLMDEVVFTAEGLPPGLEIDPTTGVISGVIAEGVKTEAFMVELTATDRLGAVTTQLFTWKVTPTFAFDAFNNPLDPDGQIGTLGSTTREVLLSQQIQDLAPEPIIAGEAKPGTVLVARLYAQDGTILAESTTSADLAGNWVLQFHGAPATANARVVVEHVATESVALGETLFRLGEDSYRSLQLGTTHKDVTTAGTILADAPDKELERRHAQNTNPLSFL